MSDLDPIPGYILPPQASKKPSDQENRDRDAWIALALLTLADIPSAIEYWKVHAAPRFVNVPLLEAGWTFDDQTQRYVDRHGHEISAITQAAIVNLLIASAKQDMQHKASRVASGEISVDAWKNHQANDLRDLIICLIALSVGGFPAITQSDLDAVKGDERTPGGLAYSLSRLQAFADSIPSMTEEAIVARAGLYADSGITASETARRISYSEAKDDKGRPRFLFERNLLMPGDNCSNSPESVGCIEETAKGWVPIGTLSVPGTRTCVMNCRCSLEYSLTGTED